jgi:hypothetical protein
LAAVLVEPTTLRGVVGHERFAHSFATFANLSVRPFLGVPLAGPPPCVCFPFLGTRSPANLAVTATLAMLARIASCLFTPRKWEVWQDGTKMST